MFQSIHGWTETQASCEEDLDVLSELSDLKRSGKELQVERRRSMLERQCSRVNVRVRFPKSQHNKCALHAPVKYEGY